jgi:glycosyltransferase involved in cell wall biosynthesis
MKVLIPAIHYYPVIGGIETWTRNIAEGVSEKAKVFVVTGEVAKEPKKELSGGVQVYRTSLFTLNNLSSSSIFYTLHLLPFIFFKSLSLIKNEKIDILHCQGFLSSLIGFCLFKTTGVPYIVTVQRLENSNPLKSKVYGNAVLCIGASRAIGEYFKKIGVKNIEIIPNGIDVKKFEGGPRQPHKGFIVMTVARLEKVKGVEYLIRAFATIAKDNQQIYLTIIGDGPERSNLEDLAASLGVGGRVKFLGEILNDELPPHLGGADCFVLSSLREGFGIVLLEAQAAGVPVIGSRVGGILDIIEDGKTGILAEPGDYKSIAEAILKIYSNSDLAKKLIENAKNNLQKYDWHKITEKVYENYISYGNISS